MTDADFDQLKANYDRDGFVVVPGYLSAAELDQLRDRAIPLARRLMDSQDSREKYQNVLKSLHRHDEWFLQQLNNGKHLPLLRHLLNDDVVGASAAWFDRPEGDTQGVEPHLDSIGRDRKFGAGATIWLALDPVDVGNGCVHYLRGSHLRAHPNVIPVPNIDTESGEAYAAELAPGDAAIHNALTVHWSGGNNTQRPRRAVSYFYFGARAHAALTRLKRA